MDRRDFLTGSTAVLGAAAMPGAAQAAKQGAATKRVLVLGGTNYIGPHIARAALEHGHEVTLFNRGYTNPGMFPHLEHLEGNRHDDRGAGLAALRGSRRWDLVIDTWQREPGCVDATARLLENRTQRYLYISSIAVFGSYREAGLGEESPTVDAAEHLRSFDPELPYPKRKRAGELAVLERYGERATVLRCSTVQGYNASASILPYWGLRFLSGEPVLVPDDASAVLQWTDARDVGRFAIDAAENDRGGIYHLINPAAPAPFEDFIAAWHAATGRRSRLVRVSPDFLARHGIQPWVDLPLYIPANDPEPGFFRIDASRAHATGFRFRPLGETLADIVRTFPNPPAPGVVAEGLGRERELDLIAQVAAT